MSFLPGPSRADGDQSKTAAKKCDSKCQSEKRPSRRYLRNIGTGGGAIKEPRPVDFFSLKKILMEVSLNFDMIGVGRLTCQAVRPGWIAMKWEQ